MLTRGINDYGMLAVTLVVLLTGIVIIAMNKKIAVIKASIIAARAKSQ
ncbi:MAG: hypothetical protein QW814_03125 [Methanothrix sp.]